MKLNFVFNFISPESSFFIRQKVSSSLLSSSHAHHEEHSSISTRDSHTAFPSCLLVSALSPPAQWVALPRVFFRKPKLWFWEAFPLFQVIIQPMVPPQNHFCCLPSFPFIYKGILSSGALARLLWRVSSCTAFLLSLPHQSMQAHLRNWQRLFILLSLSGLPCTLLPSNALMNKP